MIGLFLRLVALLAFGCVGLMMLAIAIGHTLVLPDNELLFNANLQGYDSDIYRLDIAYRLMVNITRGSNHIDTEPVWSPDGQHIAFDSNREGRYTIYLMDAQGGNVHSLRNASTYAYGPAWSPDGRSIAYLTIQFPISRELMLTDLQSGTTRRLTDNREAESFPNWSPDGRHLIFTYDGNPKYQDIFELDLQTGDINPLIVTPDTERSPIWSADGRSVLYIADGSNPGVYIWDIEHARSTLVYALTAFNIYAPDWSTDGRFMVFAPLSSNNDNHIFVLDVEACLQKNRCLSATSPAAPIRYICQSTLATTPTMTRYLIRLSSRITLASAFLVLLALLVGHRLVSTDNEIIFTGQPTNSNTAYSQLFRMDITHRLVYQLTSKFSPANSPTWSPDGQQIAFVGIMGEPPNVIYVVDAQNGTSRRLTSAHPQQHAEFSPSWSPDGRFIAYRSSRFDLLPELVITDTLSGTTRRLTINIDEEDNPTWSPDGRYLMYTSSSPNNRDIYRLDIQTGDTSSMITTPYDDLFPTWSPDGRYLLYISGSQQGDIDLWDSTSHQSILLYPPYSYMHAAPDWSPDGRYIIYTAPTGTGSAIYRLEVAPCLEKPKTCNAERMTFGSGNYADPRWRPRKP